MRFMEFFSVFQFANPSVSGGDGGDVRERTIMHANWFSPNCGLANCLTIVLGNIM